MTVTASGTQAPLYPQMPANASVEAHDAADTLVLADMFKIHTNTGDGNAQIHTLPAASVCAGCIFRVAVTVAFDITLTPASGEKIYLNGDGTADDLLVIPGTISNYADVYSDGVAWHVTKYQGAVVKAAP